MARTARLLSCDSERSRSRGSSSGMRCAVPLCHRPPNRTQTLRFALMCCTYCNFPPNSDTSQNWSPTRLPPSGVPARPPRLASRRFEQRLGGLSSRQRVAHPFLEGLGNAAT